MVQRLTFFHLTFIFGLCIVMAFVPTHGLKCYKCSWTEKACNSGGVELEAKAVECSSVTKLSLKGFQDEEAATEAPVAGDVTTVANAASGTSSPTNDSAKTYFCYKVSVKNDTTIGWERGCKETEAKENCLTIDKTKYPLAKVDNNCETCKTDKCNSAASLAMHMPTLVLLTSIVMAKLFVQKNA